MSSGRELEEELKRLLLSSSASSSSKGRPSEGMNERGERDGQETAPAKKIRKRRGKRRGKESLEEDEGVRETEAGATQRAQNLDRDRCRTAFPCGHPLTGLYGL